MYLFYLVRARNTLGGQYLLELTIALASIIKDVAQLGKSASGV
jgi:hypothetical protein